MIILTPVILLVLGIFLSAFFSGSETGFYRASRVRIVLAGLDGDQVSRWLLKLINQPSLFVATMLIGNNVANYLTSLAIVLLTHAVTTSAAAEMLAPIFLAPVLFIYGELLPKNLFYHAPNLLLRFCAPLILIFTCLFAPVAALLWGLNILLEKVIGSSPRRIQLALARKEIQQVMDEGLAAGILHPTQKQLAQNFFLVASRSVRDVCTPIGRAKVVEARTSRKRALKLARSGQLADIVLYEKYRTNVIGYVRTIDLLVHPGETLATARLQPLTSIPGTELFGEALLQMQDSRQTLARVTGAAGRTIGILSIDQLTDPLLDGSLGSLKR